MLTLTRRAGMGGAIKQTPEDFVVKEITSRGITLQPNVKYDAGALGLADAPGGKHIAFVLQKRNWNTMGALITIAKKLGHGRKSIGYAGTKDKNAVTVQLASVFHPQEFDMASIRIKDLQINGFWRSDGVELGSDLGNAFEVIVRNAASPESARRIAEELEGRIPNYFGPQRFGERMNNQKVGLAILKGDFESAVMEYLTDTANERNAKVVEARSRLKENMNFEEALGHFPRFLKGERTVLAYLSKYPKNYANAIRLLPRGLAMMFIHAVQALIFNEELEQRVEKDDFRSRIFSRSDFYGFPNMEEIVNEGKFPVAPLIGYETKEEEVSEHALETMERLGISRELFRISGLQELSMKGGYRPLLAPVKDLSCEEVGNDVKLSFSLPKGSYATVLLDEFIVGGSGI